jgi:polyferredoxin
MTSKINWNPSTKDLRWFGVVVLIGFGLIAFIVYRRGNESAATTILAVSSAVAFLAIVLPPLSRPFYFLWMLLALVLGSVMSRIIMGFIFYGVLTPVGLFFRLIKRDALRRQKVVPAPNTYWLEHPKIEDNSYYKHLF